MGKKICVLLLVLSKTTINGKQTAIQADLKVFLYARVRGDGERA
jgi:hypothetical protein